MAWDLHQKPQPLRAREHRAVELIADACRNWHVSEAAANALARYSFTHHRGLNVWLRGNEAELEQWKDLPRDLKLIESLAPVRCTAPLRLWRGTRLPIDSLPSAGDTFCDPALLSTSILRACAEAMTRRYRSLDAPDVEYQRVLLQIDVPTGSPIMPLWWARLQGDSGWRDHYTKYGPPDSVMNELEVLLARNTALHVVSVRERADGVQVLRCQTLS